MKHPYNLLLAAVLLAASATAAEPAAKRPMRDAATHDQLAVQLRTAERDDPMKLLRPVHAPDPAVANPPKDLISESDILCFGGMATLVPKRAILHTPKNLADRLKYQTGSKIVGWLDFFAQNRGWITAVEVSRVQAEGNQLLAAEIAQRIGKSSNLVVATYQTGPISVLPPKTPPAKKSDKSDGSDKADSTITPTETNQP